MRRRGLPWIAKSRLSTPTPPPTGVGDLGVSQGCNTAAERHQHQGAACSGSNTASSPATRCFGSAEGVGVDRRFSSRGADDYVQQGAERCRMGRERQYIFSLATVLYPSTS